MRGHDFGAVDTNGEYVRKAAVAPAAPSDYVVKLDTYGYALMHKKLSATEDALTKAGWQRVYGIYQNNRATVEDALIHHMPYQPGTAYTTIAANLDHEAFFKLVNGSDSDNIVNIYEDTYPAGELMIVPDFHVSRVIKDLLFANVADITDKTTPGGMLIFARPVDQRHDFDAVLADAPAGFASLRARATKDNNGEAYWVGALGLGITSRMIYPGSNQKMNYVLEVALSDPAAAALLTDVLGLVNERAKASLYTGEDGKSADGISITNVYDKNKVRLLKITSSGQQNRLVITFYQP